MRDLGKSIVAKCFEKVPKVQKIAQYGQTVHNVKRWFFFSHLFGIESLWPTLKVPQIVRKIISLGNADSGKLVVDKVLRDHNKQHLVQLVPENFMDLLVNFNSIVIV